MASSDDQPASRESEDPDARNTESFRPLDLRGVKRERQFSSIVFPAELAEIRERRASASRQDPEAGSQRLGPSVQHGLTGLACSGGGIRSASFCLGVVQYLLKAGYFSQFDYLSTVSGGGYLGSLLSSLMGRDSAKGQELLVRTHGTGHMPARALSHVRNGSNYLAPGGAKDSLRIPAVVLAGIGQILLMLVPLVVGLVFLTECAFQLSDQATLWLNAKKMPIGELLDASALRELLPLLGSLPFVLFVLVRRVQLTRGDPKTSWGLRNSREHRLGSWLFASIVSVVLVPFFSLVDWLVSHNVTSLRLAIAGGLELDRGWTGPFPWALLGCALVLLVLLARKPRQTLGTLAVVSGPALLLLFFFGACVRLVNTPFYSAAKAKTDPTSQQAALASCQIECRENPDSCLSECGIIRDALVDKGYDPGNFKVEVKAPVKSSAVSACLVGFAERQGPKGWMPEVLSTAALRKLTFYGLQQEGSVKLIVPELALLPVWSPLKIRNGNSHWFFGGHTEWWFYLSALALLIFNWIFGDINRLSLHPFYRDRLSRTFLLRPDAEDSRGFVHNDELKLSETRQEGSTAPYHLVNCALNLQGSSDSELRERRTVPFVFSKLFTGSEKTGYCSTRKLEKADPYMNLGTAMAISAAAAAPNMGTVSNKLSFIMTMLNLRLAYWLPHPARVEKRSGPGAGILRRPGLKELLVEALGIPSEKGRFVNCSDGGHIENLGVYELLRRRCRFIVCVDAEADPGYLFHGLVTLQRYASIDLDTQIELDVSKIRPQALPGTANGSSASSLNETHFALGSIDYPEGEKGAFLYIKLSYSGDEPNYVQSYRHEHPAFPHESTADQFFTETQLEVYRALGEHIAQRAFQESVALEESPSEHERESLATIQAFMKTTSSSLRVPA